MYDQYLVACNHVFLIHQSLSLFLVVMMLLLAFLAMEGLISIISVLICFLIWCCGNIFGNKTLVLQFVDQLYLVISCPSVFAISLVWCLSCQSVDYMREIEICCREPKLDDISAAQTRNSDKICSMCLGNKLKIQKLKLIDYYHCICSFMWW